MNLDRNMMNCFALHKTAIQLEKIDEVYARQVREFADAMIAFGLKMDALEREVKKYNESPDVR